jgi:hypothetical protein
MIAGIYAGWSDEWLVQYISELMKMIAYQHETRQRIPAWSSLLQIYLGFFIPVMFGLLVSLNIVVWAYVRINYVFIFG